MKECFYSSMNKYTYPHFILKARGLGRFTMHVKERTAVHLTNICIFQKLSPLRFCREDEDTKHFLFDCQHFQNLRRELLNKITVTCQPTINIHSRGIETLQFFYREYMGYCLKY